LTTEACTVADLIPHRGRMCLIDGIETIDEQHGGVLLTRVGADWPLVEGDRLDPLVLVEVVAQAAAVLAGWRRRHQERMGGRGWLVGVRRTELPAEPPAVGDVLRVRVQVDYEVEAYAVFKGRVERAGRTLAEVEIQTYRPADDFWADGE